jgi:hypothetical protein
METNTPKELDVWHPFNLIKRIDDFFAEYINPYEPDFFVDDFKDGRKESEKQENPIREFLMGHNDNAANYGFMFKNRLNEDNERSTEDLIIQDLLTPQPTEHLANIKSLNSKNKSNIGKDEIIGYALTGENKAYKTAQITDLFLKKIQNNDRQITGGFYYYITYKKDKKTFSTHELSYMVEKDILVNPTNFLQSAMAHESIYRTSEERFEFFFDKWKTYFIKNNNKFRGMDKYV